MRVFDVALLLLWIAPLSLSTAHAAEPQPSHEIALRPILPLGQVNGVSGISIIGFAGGLRLEGDLEIEVGALGGTVFNGNTYSAWARGGGLFDVEPGPGFDLSYVALLGPRCTYENRDQDDPDDWGASFDPDDGTKTLLTLSGLAGLEWTYRWAGWGLTARTALTAQLPIYTDNQLNPEYPESGFGGELRSPFGWDLTLGVLF